MNTNEIGPREIKLLRFYVLFQFSIYLLSLIARLLVLQGNSIEVVNWVRFVPAAILFVIFFILGLERYKQGFTRTKFLYLLILLSVTTIISRFLSPDFSIDRAQLMPGVFNFGFDQIFFLILPVLFVAWQFSRSTMFLYCGFITVVEIAISLLSTKTDFFSFWILIVTIVFRGVIFGIMGFFVNSMSEVQQLQQEKLEKANARLRKYAINTEQLAQTRERNRLARELHDTLAHTLSSVAVQLEAVKALFDTNQEEAKKGLERSLVTTRNGLNETRRALKDLRTSELENFGLCQSLRNLLQSGAARGGFKYTENLVETLNLLPDEISHAIYRTVQEAVDNTVKHAKAKNVDLQIDQSEKTMQMTYSDDGQGFSLENLEEIKHYGLQGMQERITLLGGKFTIQSAPNQGTKIIIKMELENDKNIDL
ncbi:MAG: sensor histidine kinase [Anaerolineaceae bacterium]